MSTAVFDYTHSSQSPKPSTPSGWDCIEALSNPHDKPKPEIYVHPLVKRSASMLSDKSLEMCTENLGSETGTDVTMEDILSIFSSDHSDSEESSVSKERKRKLAQRMEARKAGYESLPPPLTILRGVNSVRVQPLREEGRLVMNVVSTSPRKPDVISRRIDGRLTMTLVEDDEARDGETSGETEHCECEEVMEITSGRGEEEEEEESLEEEEEEDDEELKDALLVVEEGKDGINVEVGGKYGKGKVQRLSRCKESERGSRRRLINMETFWVV